MKDSFNILLFNKVKHLARQYPTHPYIGQFIAGISYNSKDLNAEQLSEIVSILDTTRQNPRDIKQLQRGIASLQKYGIGKPFFPFKLVDSQGKVLELKNFKGKPLFLDFWASWCGPCIGVHQSLLEIKKKYPANNCKIVSISIVGGKCKTQHSNKIIEHLQER